MLMNPSATGADDRAEELEAALAEREVDARLEVVEPERLVKRVRELAASPIIGVAGGDGTLRSVADALPGQGTIVAPIPFGRFNNVCRRLGMPDVESAVSAIAEGRVCSPGAGEIDGQLFLSTAVLGSYRSFVKARDRWFRSLPFGLAALAAVVATLRHWPVSDVSVETRDGRLERRTALLWVGVGRGSYPIPRKARPGGPEGELEMVLFPDTRRGAAVALLKSLLRTSSSAAGPLEIIHTRQANIRSEGGIEATLDGEPRTLRSSVRLEYVGDRVRLIDGRDPRA